MPSYGSSRTFVLLSTLTLLAASLAGCEKSAGTRAPDSAAVSPPGAGRPLPLGNIDPSTLPLEEATLGIAPEVAPPITRDHDAKVIVHLEVIEKVMDIAEGAQYTFWTFGGTVPGPMIRVRRGDFVEFHLMNHPNNTMPHNIDLHAVTGPGGGATSSFTAPGHQTQFSFRALNPGAYIYHCATAPVGMHVANGMYGLIVVEPEEGYPRVDREFYVVQSEFYSTGDFREPGLQPFDMQRAIDENPSYVVFNGRDGSLTGDNAIKAHVGETVRLFVGNGGPNLVSSFHVIGEIFDRVWSEGGDAQTQNVQTTLIPAGGSAIVDFKMEVPGTFILVDHSLFRAFHKGAVGLLQADGPEDKIVYSGREVDEVYLAERAPQEGTEAGAAVGDDLAASVRRGQTAFLGTCSTCHQRNGEGLAGVFPPLTSSDFLMADKRRSIDLVLRGLTGPIQVNGKPFNGVMPPFANLTDHEIADVLTFVRNSFGNRGEAVTDAEVAAARAGLPQTDTSTHP